MRHFTSVSRILLGVTSAVCFHNFSFASLSRQKVLTYSRFQNIARTMTTVSESIPGTSIHAAHINEIHDVPFEVLIRSFPSELDESKVLNLMETLKNPETRENVPPVDVLWITGREGGNYYYSFGGCHRYEAHKRLGLPTIRCKLVKSTVNDLRHYLGGSTPDLK